MSAPDTPSRKLLGLSRTGWALLCMLVAMGLVVVWLVVVWLFSPMWVLVDSSDREGPAQSGWIVIKNSANFEFVGLLRNAFWSTPSGSVKSRSFWVYWRVAHYEIFLVGGLVGISLLPILHGFRRLVPEMMRRSALIFFVLAVVGMSYYLVETYQIASFDPARPYLTSRTPVRYGMWLPPVFFTLAFLSVLLSGAGASPKAESSELEERPAA